jgi:hypothetical protein
MISLTLFSTCLLMQAAPLPLPLDSGPVIRTEVVVCGECGVKVTAVAAMIDELRRAPRGSDREDAARDLRGIAWKCHPDVVVALSDSLLHDPDFCVRREAAESLTKLGACQAEAHLALQRAAVSDRNLFVRAQAKRGLKALSHRCVGACEVCETGMPVASVTGTPVVVRRAAPPTRIINLPGVHIAVTPGRAFGIEFGRRRQQMQEVVVLPPAELDPRELAPVPEELPPFSPRTSAPQPPEPGAALSVPGQPVERRLSQKPALPSSERAIQRSAITSTERSSPKPAPRSPERPRPKPTVPPADLPPLIGPSQGTPG